MNLIELKKIDSMRMFEIYDMWPDIARKSYIKKYNKINYLGIKHIVFAGMGGSGTLGDIFSSILSKTKIHVDVVKGYHLPKTINKNTLVVAISISGNTEEILKILRDARKLDCKLIAFASGGKMEKLCKNNKIEFRKIEKFHSPRASFPSFLYSILNILSPILPIKKKDILESIKKLEKLESLISSNNINQKNPSLKIAQWLVKTPLIYYPWGLQSVAIRFKNSLQENSKDHVVIEDVIESCHNGIVAWEKKSEIQPILIKGKDDHHKTKEKWKILAKYFIKNKIDYREINSVDGNILSKIICLIYLLDYCSIYKAVIEKIDPSPVKSIEYMKKKYKRY